MTTAERNSSKLTVKTTKEDEGGKQEVTASLAGSKEIVMDTPVVGGFLRAARDFNIERRAKNSTEGFSHWSR